MNLRIVREPSVDGATLSVWFIDGHFECFGVEDQIREKEGQPVASWKVPRATAIPAGRYRVTITHSTRFRRPLPLLHDVPGFAGIRLHPGNTIEDTEGCLLPGKVRWGRKVGDSRVAFERVFSKIETALARGEHVWISIENPQPSAAAVA